MIDTNLDLLSLKCCIERAQRKWLEMQRWNVGGKML